MVDEQTPRHDDRTPRFDAGSVFIAAMGLLLAIQAVWFIGT